MEETGNLYCLAKDGKDRMLRLSANCKCTIGIYPFMEGKLEDFEPVFAELIKAGPLF